MSTPKPKAFTWRMTEIPGECTKEEILDFFVAEDRDRIKVESLYPDVEGKNLNVATILVQPRGDRMKDDIRLDPEYADSFPIDKLFDDFTPLYQPPDDTMITADIIALTGLAGHAFGSWAHADNKMWLRDYLPSVAPTARIMTYGYNSPISGDITSCNTIEDFGEKFFNDLIAVRKNGKCEQRPIIFIGHSLGGLIIKNAIASAWSRNVDHSRLPVRSIIFLGVPHNGMETDALRTLVRGSPPETLIRELEPGSLTLRHLNKEFKKIAVDVSIWTLWESLTTRTVALDPVANRWSRSGPGIIMVPEQSARLDLQRETVIPSDADHSSIAKIKRSQKTTWRILTSALQEGLGATEDTIADRPQQQQYLGTESFGTPASTSDPTTSRSPVPWSNGSTAIGRTYPGQQRHSSPVGSPFPQSSSSSLPVRPAFNTAATDTTSLSPEWSHWRPSTPQPPIMSQAEQLDDPATGIREAMHCTCNSSIPGDGKVRTNCVKCSTVLYPLDSIWTCAECKAESGVCSDCHARWSMNGKCVQHKDKRASRNILVVAGLQLLSVAEKTLSIESWYRNQTPSRSSLLTIKKWFSSRDEHDDLRVPDISGQGRLHIAAQMHMSDEMDTLLESKGDQINRQDSAGHTPLMTAVMNGRACIVQKLLDSGAEVDSIRDQRGGTPLHIACYWGFESIAFLLINAYSMRGLTTINKLSHSGWTALGTASRRKQWKIVIALLGAGADPLAEAPDGEGADKSLGNQIGMLAGDGSTEAVELLLKTCDGLSVECRDNAGRTLLSQAAAGWHSQLCETLLKTGADPDVEPARPPYPILHYAVGKGHNDVVEALLNDSRTKIEATDAHGCTALLLAVLTNQLEVVRTLLKKGANAEPKPGRPTFPSARTGRIPSSKLTPLHVAATDGYLDMCRLLLDHGADANVQLPIIRPDGAGRILTPLFSATEAGNLPICKMLVEAGANVNLMLNKARANGWVQLYSPLHVAARLGHQHIVSYLIRQGAAATPPPWCGGKWKNFEFDSRVGEARMNSILGVLRAHKHQ